jgi:hypothetical protein
MTPPKEKNNNNTSELENKKMACRQNRKNSRCPGKEVIRVRHWTYEELGELGSSKNDFDDVIFTLIEFWKKHHKHG